MLKKWVINVVVTVPTLFLGSSFFIILAVRLGYQMDVFQGTFHPYGPDEVMLYLGVMLVLSLLWMLLSFAGIATLLYACVSLVRGEGLIYRRIDEGDFLQNTDGSVFREFKKKELLWRLDPAFAGRKLLSQSCY